ncbi:hypothetical protein [Paenibacillus sp. YN15]|uniref:hypothetical protein n=1 Tax=Paenibacillus sp. YN15 TaxID=1742774 RepID=UPI000DCDB0AA|nr:hypothetical protein [Paenibacillus sp. YN15]RAV03020.1 hypothetical protein DQG13_08070 [Paenibacillus sp. YN15]
MSDDARARYFPWLRFLIPAAAAAVLLLSAGFAAPPAPAPAGQAQIERFDVKKGQVTDRIPITAEMQQELRKLAQSASGSAGTFRIDPPDGTVLHFPLQPAVEIRQRGFFALAAEAYLFLPADREPYILFFSEENEPRLFGLKHPVNRLLALCGWEEG